MDASCAEVIEMGVGVLTICRVGRERGALLTLLLREMYRPLGAKAPGARRQRGGTGVTRKS